MNETKCPVCESTNTMLQKKVFMHTDAEAYFKSGVEGWTYAGETEEQKTVYCLECAHEWEVK